MALLFSEMVFDGYVHGGYTGDSDVTTWALLGTADKFFIEAKVAEVTGTSPALTIVIQHSNDGVNWSQRSNPMNAVALNANSNIVEVGTDTGTTPMGRYAKVVVSIEGTSNPGAYVSVTVTGRSE